MQFECWGAYRINDSNIGGGADGETTRLYKQTAGKEKRRVAWIGCLLKNWREELNRMDAFLVCYDVEKDQSKGTNYHKIIEYLSTGKVIVSNNVTTYAGREELVQMIAGRQSNAELPALFT